MSTETSIKCATHFCACPGFAQLVDAKIIKRYDGTLLRHGEMVDIHYYHLGKNGPGGFMLAHCPACGGRVRDNEEFIEQHTKGRGA